MTPGSTYEFLLVSTRPFCATSNLFELIAGEFTVFAVLESFRDLLKVRRLKKQAASRETAAPR